MNAYVLLSILSLFSNKFNKFNITGARILDSIYHMTLRLLLKSHFWRKKFKILRFCHFILNIVMVVIS